MVYYGLIWCIVLYYGDLWWFIEIRMKIIDNKDSVTT